jgi:hypothetical protein
MTIKEIRHQYMGSEFGEADCFTCYKKSIGMTVLNSYHNGYGDKAHPASDNQIKDVRKAAYEHDKQFPAHEIKILFGHKESILENGVSKVVYELKK